MISFVYFDVGGVVIKDFSKSSKWEEMLGGMGVSETKKADFLEILDQHDEVVCGGDIETLIPLLKQKLGIKVPEDYSLVTDFVKRFEVNWSIWPVVEAAKRKTPIGLMTNMYRSMLQQIRAAGLLPPVKWDTVVDSSEVGTSKPQRKIFEIAQKRAQTPGREILFVDNSLGHIEAAKKIGWQTFLYDSADYERSSRALQEFIDGHCKD